MPVTRHASSYVRFLNLVNAVRQMPHLPVLDAVEERLDRKSTRLNSSHH